MNDEILDIDELLASKNIPIIWAPKDYFEQGNYIAPCKEFPNGAIIVSLGMSDSETKWTKIHEANHLLEGTQLLSLTSPLIHYGNEYSANCAIIRDAVHSFVEENENALQHATASRLCEMLNLNYNEYCQVAEEEIKEAVWDKYHVFPALRLFG